MRPHRAPRLLLLLLLLCPAAQAQSGWRLAEETTISGTVSGTVQMGTVFRTVSGNLYEVAEPVIRVVVLVMPRASVYARGDLYRLHVAGIDQPLLCRKLNGARAGSGSGGGAAAPTEDVIDTRIDGEFSGFDGETILRLANGQIWVQTEYYYHYRYAYGPRVTIYRTQAGTFKARVEGVDRAVGVRRLR